LGDNLVPNGLSMVLQGSLFPVDVSQIIVHEADEPNAVVDFCDAEPLSGEHGGTFVSFRIMQIRPHAATRAS